jgi:hypothetical protein
MFEGSDVLQLKEEDVVKFLLSGTHLGILTHEPIQILQKLRIYLCKIPTVITETVMCKPVEPVF